MMDKGAACRTEQIRLCCAKLAEIVDHGRIGRRRKFAAEPKEAKIDAVQLSIPTEQPITIKKDQHQCEQVCGGKGRTVEL